MTSMRDILFTILCQSGFCDRCDTLS